MQKKVAKNEETCYIVTVAGMGPKTLPANWSGKKKMIMNEKKLEQLEQSAKTQDGNIFNAGQVSPLNEAYEMGVSARKTGKSLKELIWDGEIEGWVFEDRAANLFFEAGFEGKNKPEFVTAFRFGQFNSKSYNFRDNRPEAGVSVFAIKGKPIDSTVWATSELFFSNKPIYKVLGWLVEGKLGSDGEPLVVPCEA